MRDQHASCFGKCNQCKKIEEWEKKKFGNLEEKKKKKKKESKLTVDLKKKVNI